MASSKQSAMSQGPRNIRIEDFDYTLPENHIARYPRDKRSDSKLMTYQSGVIKPDMFYNIGQYLHSGDTLVLNDTKVIPARLHFQKHTGAQIEIFCLQPFRMDHQQAMDQREQCEWETMIGGAKRWKEGLLEKEIVTDGNSFLLKAERIGETQTAFVVRFTWNNPSVSFSEILHQVGELPLPPYFDRDAEEQDYDRYQTVFATFEGSVAAPTAGLHFTPEILEDLRNKGVNQQRITLHVGSGTFKPVSSSTMEGHSMHGEIFDVSPTLISSLQNTKGRIIPVGTTSMRTIESLYWFGVKILNGHFESNKNIQLDQWDAYELPQHTAKDEALQAVVDYCKRFNLQRFSGSTSLLIAPGYQMRVSQGIITNFHLPKSTLILLVAALIGEDWRSVYKRAIEEDFQFLSYGDSSLLLPK